MAEIQENISREVPMTHISGRGAQTGFYFKKFWRMFAFQRGWIVLLMAAVISGLSGLAMGEAFLFTLEKTMTGTLALVFTCIWNGAYSSIRAVCGHKEILRRQYRRGMHISSWLLAQILYQLLLCMLLTAVTILMTSLAGVRYTGRGLFTGWIVLDLSLTIFLITFASDMMALWISSLAYSDAAALTVLPFVLVFQLLFTGSIIPVADFARPVTNLTISCPGYNAVSAQADINHLPMSTVTEMLSGMDDVSLSGSITIGQVLDALSEKENATVAKLRSMKVGKVETVGEILNDLATSKDFEILRRKKLLGSLTAGDIITVLNDEGVLGDYREKTVGVETTLGEIVDAISAVDGIETLRDKEYRFNITMGEALDIVGREKTNSLIMEKASQIYYDERHENDRSIILGNWLRLLLCILAYGALFLITLEVRVRYCRRPCAL